MVANHCNALVKWWNGNDPSLGSSCGWVWLYGWQRTQCGTAGPPGQQPKMNVWGFKFQEYQDYKQKFLREKTTIHSTIFISEEIVLEIFIVCGESYRFLFSFMLFSCEFAIISKQIHSCSQSLMCSQSNQVQIQTSWKIQNQNRRKVPRGRRRAQTEGREFSFWFFLRSEVEEAQESWVRRMRALATLIYTRTGGPALIMLLLVIDAAHW